MREWAVGLDIMRFEIEFHGIDGLSCGSPRH